MKNKKGTILALVTAQPSCDRIIKIAEDYANKLDCSLTVLTAQPLKTNAENRSKDMIILTELSKTTGKEIKIIYSNKPLLAVLKETEKICPIHIFVGQGGKKSEFLTGLRIFAANSPISVVGEDSIIFSLPPLPENTLNKTYSTH